MSVKRAVLPGGCGPSRKDVVFALGVCIAAVLRAVLPNGSVGLLQVRSRFVDVLTLAALGGATLVAALIVPPPS